MPAMIHTARPDGYLDYLNKRWLEYLGVMMYDVSRVGLSFIARLKGLWPRGEPASRPEKNSDTKLAPARRMGNIAGSSIARCHSATGAATNSTSKI